MTTVLASLSGAGWIEDPALQLKTLFANAIVSDESQSTIYSGSITSIPYIVAKFKNNQIELANELEAALTAYYNRYFTDSSISVEYSNPDSAGIFNLYLAITVTRNSKTYSLKAQATVDKGVLADVFELINT